MKGEIIFGLVFVILLLPFVSCASEFPSYYNDYVNDFAKIFSQNETNMLVSLLSDTRTQTTAEVVLVTVNNLSSYAPSEYATRLFTQWQIGKSDKDNGLLILYAVLENKLWVTTGYGLEGILPDSKIGRILDESYVPLRDQNKVKEGIINATNELVKVIYSNADEVKSGNTEKSIDYEGNKGLIFIWILILFFAIIPAIIKLFVKKKKFKKKPTKIWDILFWMWLGNSFGHGSSFGGGGFSGGGFGGGGTGGGGAGR